MNQKDNNDGIVGVVSDLIHVDKRYETAIETALGGNIQNIVTRDEETATDDSFRNRIEQVDNISPMTSVKAHHFKDKQDIFKEQGTCTSNLWMQRIA